MPPRDALVTAVTRAVQSADAAADVRESVCAAAVDAGYEFACLRGRDGAYAAASRDDVDPPDPADVVPTFRSAASTGSASDSDANSPPVGPGAADSPSDAADLRSDSADSPSDAADLSADAEASAVGSRGPDPSVDASPGACSAPADAAPGGSGAADKTPADRPVTCISREDGYTVTVPVVDRGDEYGTLALGTSERVGDAERDHFAAVGAVVGQALARLAVARERDALRETLHRERGQFEQLHSVAARMVDCEDATSIYQLAIDAAENILEFDVCGIDVAEDGHLVPKATSTEMEPDSFQPIPATEGVAGETFQENETIVVDDVAAHPLADPANSEYESVLSVPIEDVGVFQAGAKERDAFSRRDAELAELLMAHVAATLQRLRSDAALRESEAKYRTLVEQSHDAVAIYRDGGFEFVNQRATGLFARPLDALLDADPCRLFHPEDRAKLERIAGELTGEPGRQQTFEGRIRRPNGDVRFCEFSTTSITYEGDVAVLASIRDITERKERERDLERQNERLEEFASVVSHDLRSPINVARGSVDLAADTGDLSHLDRAEDALDRMEALVEDVLRLARQGRFVSDTERVSLRDVAADAWRSVDAPDATLDVPADATVDADRTRLRELFENLFRNAVEHAGSDVTVTVSPKPDGFAVVDDGPGLPDGAHDEVFERGFTSVEDGTGFGLAIVESIAEAHGWTVEACPPPGDDDSASSRGAAFEVSGCRLE